MQKSVEYSLRAGSNLKKIKAYIEAENQSAALRVIEHIVAAADNLENFPMLGRVGETAGIRELVLTKYPYIIVYRLTTGKVRIVAVLHQSKQV